MFVGKCFFKCGYWSSFKVFHLFKTLSAVDLKSYDVTWIFKSLNIPCSLSVNMKSKYIISNQDLEGKQMFWNMTNSMSHCFTRHINYPIIVSSKKSSVCGESLFTVRGYIALYVRVFKQWEGGYQYKCVHVLELSYWHVCGGSGKWRLSLEAAVLLTLSLWAVGADGWVHCVIYSISVFCFLTLSVPSSELRCREVSR